MNRKTSTLLSLGISAVSIAAAIWLLYRHNAGMWIGNSRWPMGYHHIIGGGMGIVLIIFWIVLVGAFILLVSGAAILYLLPILGLMLGAFMGIWASTALGLSESLGSIVGAAAGLCIGYVAVIGWDRSPRIRRRIMPTITAILTPKVDLPET
jgi:hypothetical protein